MERKRRMEAKRSQIEWRRDGIIWRGSGEKRKGGGSKEVEEVWMRKEHEERRKQRMGRVRTEMEEEE